MIWRSTGSGSFRSVPLLRAVDDLGQPGSSDRGSKLKRGGHCLHQGKLSSILHVLAFHEPDSCSNGCHHCFSSSAEYRSAPQIFSASIDGASFLCATIRPPHHTISPNKVHRCFSSLERCDRHGHKETQHPLTVSRGMKASDTFPCIILRCHL